MTRSLAALVLFTVAGLLAAQVPAPPSSKAQPATAKNAGSAVIRFDPAPRAVAGENSATESVAVSEDGKRVASGGGSYNPGSGFVLVIDISTKKELLALRLPQAVNAIALSPDGKRVSYVAQTGNLRVLEVGSGKTLVSRKLDGGARPVISRDGRLVACVTQGKTVRLCSGEGEEIAKFTDSTVAVYGLAISPDGKRIAAGGGEFNPMTGAASGLIFIWDAAKKSLLHKIDADLPINTIAFSADGNRIAGTGTDNRTSVWDAADGKLVSTTSSQRSVSGMAFSPDGRTLAIAHDDGSGTRLFNPATGEESGPPLGPQSESRSLAFTPDGKHLVSGGLGRSLKLWDVSGGKPPAILREGLREDDVPAYLAMAATADGSLIALGAEDNTILLREGHTGELKGMLKGHGDAVTCLAFSPDGKTLASGSADKSIKLWNVAKGTERATLAGHANWVYALAYSHDGKTLASGGYDRTVRLWNASSGAAMASIEAHRGAVRAVAFSPDDQTLATGGADRFLKAWSVADRTSKFEVKAHEGAVRAAAFSPDGKTLATGGDDGEVKLWDAADGKSIIKAPYKAHQNEVTFLAFVDGSLLISGAAGGGLNQWETPSGKNLGALQAHNGAVRGIAIVAGGREMLTAGADLIVKRFRRDVVSPLRLLAGHSGAVQSVAFSSDGKRLVSCGNWPEGDKTLRVWSVPDGKEVLKIDHPGEATIAKFTPNGKYIASCSMENNAYLWDAVTGARIRVFKGHTASVNGLAIDKDGSKMLTSSTDKTVRLWDVATGDELRVFKGHTDMIRRVVFHPDGKHVLSGGRDGLVRMWDLKSGNEVKQFKCSGKWADSLDVSSDGRFLAVGSQTVLVYEIESGKVHSECVGHQYGVTQVAFSPDGSRLLTASYDFSARLWDADSGRELYRFKGHREFAFAAAFSPDGKWLATGGGGFSAGNGKYEKGTDHAVRLWQTPDEQMIRDFVDQN